MGTMKLVAVLIACGSVPPRTATIECPCPCLVDAGVDATPTEIDLALDWTRTEIVASSPTLRGADGVALDADGCWVTAWEESGSVTRACPAPTGGYEVEVELVASGLSGPEDSKPGDLDGDGIIDVITALDGGSRVVVTFRGAPNVTIVISESQSTGRVMQVAVADVDNDGHDDILYGSRAHAAARIAWCRNPGADARIGLLWDCSTITPAGWAMSIVPRDINSDGRADLVVSDRAKLTSPPAGVSEWTYFGARWVEQMPDGSWLNHTIAGGAPTSPATPYQTGSCSPYASTTCERTPGDEMFLAVDGNDVIDCTSLGSQPDSRITIHSTTDWLSWTHVTLPAAVNVGHCQGVLPMDVDLDGDRDMVVTAWKGNALPLAPADASKSGVYLLRNNGDGTYSRGEISGPDGAKWDNAIADGRCVVTSEQLGDPVGGRGVERFCPPGAQ